MNDASNTNDRAQAGIIARPSEQDGLIAHGVMRVECVRDGRVIWVEEGPNLIVTTGRNKLLDETLAGSGYTAAWYMGLIDNAGFSAIAAGDTMASHAGWTESTTYDEGARPTISFAAASAGSKATSAAVVFTISGTVTINGVFITTVSTKGGSTGTLFAGKSFSATRAVVDNDVLNVTYTASLTAS